MTATPVSTPESACQGGGSYLSIRISGMKLANISPNMMLETHGPVARLKP